MAAKETAGAIFCPQNKPPKVEYMQVIRQTLLQHPTLQPLRQAVETLQDTWNIYAKANEGIRDMHQGPRYIEAIQSWLQQDEAKPLTEIMSGIIALPVLTIIQVVQYFKYLEHRGISHQELLEELSVGGAQGLCGGMLPVSAIASSSSEEEVAHNAAKSVRIALGIGAYAELGDDQRISGPTAMVLRTKYDDQAEELVAKFSDIYISVISEPKIVSVVGPVQSLAVFKSYVETHGLKCTPLYLRGKIHNPENREVSEELIALCHGTEELRLPNASSLQIPVRANDTGKVISGQDVQLSAEVIKTALVSKSMWYDLMGGVADDTFASASRQITITAFGTGRKQCVPLKLFQDKGLEVKLHDAETYGASQNEETHPSLPDDSIAIVGAGCRLPGAESLDELWDLLSAGESKVSEIPLDRFDPTHVPRKSMPRKGSAEQPKLYGNFIDNVKAFDNAFFGVSSKEASYMDPQQRLLLETAYEALDSSGYLRNHNREDYDNVGCFLGSTYTEYLENTCGYAPTAYTPTGTIRAFQNGKISYHFGWSGPSEVIDTACSSSLVAIHRACKAIQGGECPMALAGGVNIITGVHNYLDLGKAGFLSQTGQCKPFDSRADGYCRADGVGLVVLKTLAQATVDGDEILGVIPAVATNHGGLSPGITVPYSRAQVDLFNRVLKKSTLQPDQISYIEAHGTGTQVGDPIEIGSIREVFGGPHRKDDLHIGSIKANVGHSETAAGVGSLLKVLAMIQHEKIPPLAGFNTLNPRIPALKTDRLTIDTNTKLWNSSVRAALVNSYGAAGSNSALICCQSMSRKRQKSHYSEDRIYPIVLSAATGASLQKFRVKLSEYLKRNSGCEQVTISNLAYTLSERREHHPVRYATLARTLGELVNSFDKESSLVSQTSKETTRPVVLAFAGQSQRTIGLCRSWYQRFPRLRWHLDQCNSIVHSMGHGDLIPALFQQNPLEDIVALQCGTFAVQYASAMSWIDAGLKVNAVVGHSFGELTALAVSGVLSLKNALKLVASRAELMERKWSPERGVMLAVHAKRMTVEEIVKKVEEAGFDRTLEVACFNGPSSQILVGSLAEIIEAERLLSEGELYHGIKYQRLNVTHGFHSVFTEPILEDLSAVSHELNFLEGGIWLESCTKTSLHGITAKRIAEHTRRPVFFQEAIGRLEGRLGPCVWLEAGGSSPIIGMVKRNVSNQSQHVFLPIKMDGTTDSVTKTSTMLWHEGHPSAFWEFASPKDSDLQPVWLPPYQFQKAEHWLEYKSLGPFDENSIDAGPARMGVLDKPPQLVMREKTLDTSSAAGFTVHTETERFQDIARGHAFRGRPLCPASMYMECVVMGVQALLPHHNFSFFGFKNLQLESGLGTSSKRAVQMALAPADESQNSWNFTFSSYSRAAENSRSQVHAKGSFEITLAPDFGLYERLILDRIDKISGDHSAEQLRSQRAYTLFSRVVEYGECMRGIHQVSLLGNEAAAVIKRPKKPVSQDSSTVSRLCDTVDLDTFIQVVGLLINSSEKCGINEAFIASHIGSIMLQAYESQDVTSHKVYVKIWQKGSTRVIGDMLAFTEQGMLICALSAVQFTKLPIAKLETMLDSSGINDKTDVTSEAPSHAKAKSRPENNSNLRATKVGISASDELSTFMPDFTKNKVASTQFFPGTQALTSNTPFTDQESTATSVFRPTPNSSSTTSVDIHVSEEALRRTGPLEKETQTAMQSIRQRVLRLVAENSGALIDDIQVTETIDAAGIDSLSGVELREALEGEFQVDLPGYDVFLGLTIDGICGHISQAQS